MKQAPTDAQRRHVSSVLGICLGLWLLLMTVEHWTVFLPYAATLHFTYLLYAFFFVLYGYVLARQAKNSIPRKFKNFVALLIGLIIACWGSEQASYGLLMATNAISSAPWQPLCLNVVDNLDAPEGFFSRTHTIKVYQQSEPQKDVMPVRYRYPEIAFRGLVSGDQMQVQARPGWAGYTLSGVTTRIRCKEPNNSFKPKPLRGSA